MDIKSDIEFIGNVFKLLIGLPGRLWYRLGCILPPDWIFTSWDKKPIQKRLRSLEKIGSVPSEIKNICFAPDFFIVDDGVRDVTRSEASTTIQKLKLDAHRRYRYSGIAHQNPTNPDLIELTLSHKECSAPLVLLINNHLGNNEEFTDFAQQDCVSLILDGDNPIFIYNHHTHVLANCDFYDLHIHERAGVELHEKGQALAKQVQEAVMLAREAGYFLNTGKKGPRVALYHHSFDEMPLVISKKFRDVWEWLFFAVLGLMALATLVMVMQEFWPF